MDVNFVFSSPYSDPSMLTVRQALIDDADQLNLNNLLFITAFYSNKSVF